MPHLMEFVDVYKYWNAIIIFCHIIQLYFQQISHKKDWRKLVKSKLTDIINVKNII